MDIEGLTKTQTILLTLLVSFVTSIATGIVTVTLLDQAPPAITQTINRVVERTIERAVPNDNQGAVAVTTEKTVVVKEDDLLSDSIQKNTKNLVRLSATTADGSQTFVGVGVVVARQGVVATAASQVQDGVTYTAVAADGQTYQASVVAKPVGKNIALLELSRKSEEGESEEVTLSPIAFASIDSLKLGQTVLALSGKERTQVAAGIIAGIAMEAPAEAEEGEEAPAPKVRMIETTIQGTNIVIGSPLTNIFGEIIGMRTATTATSAGDYTPVTEIQEELSNLLDRSSENEGEGSATTTDATAGGESNSS